jgi:putative FmdB family regulatory protein
MPIYEYDCPKCGVIEVTQRITESPLAKCPTCKRKVKKLISATSFQLKGEGWYVTDYGRKGKKGGDGEKKTATPADSPAKSDAKPSTGSGSTEKTTS